MNLKPLRRQITHGLRRFGVQVSRVESRSNVNFPGYVEQEFRDLYRIYQPYSMVPWAGLYGAYKAAHYVIKAGIEGDIVECGVWKGGCSALMMATFKNAGQTHRKFYLYDTFDGMTPPTEKDVHFSGAQNAVTKYRRLSRNGKKWSYADLDTCRTTVAMSGYPAKSVTYVQGDVSETLKTKVPQKIALLRLDTDWYESTWAEMQALYPSLNAGGVLIADDYGAWRGSYEAIHDYLKVQNIHNLCLHVDTSYGGMSAVKP